MRTHLNLLNQASFFGFKEEETRHSYSEWEKDVIEYTTSSSYEAVEGVFQTHYGNLLNKE